MGRGPDGEWRSLINTSQLDGVVSVCWTDNCISCWLGPFPHQLVPNIKELFRLVEDFVEVIGLQMEDFQDTYEATDNLGQSLATSGSLRCGFPVQVNVGMCLSRLHSPAVHSVAINENMMVWLVQSMDCCLATCLSDHLTPLPPVLSVHKRPATVTTDINFPVRGWRGMMEWVRRSEDKVTITQNAVSTAMPGTNPKWRDDV